MPRTIERFVDQLIHQKGPPKIEINIKADDNAMNGSGEAPVFADQISAAVR